MKYEVDGIDGVDGVGWVERGLGRVEKVRGGKGRVDFGRLGFWGLGVWEIEVWCVCGYICVGVCDLFIYIISMKLSY